MAADTPEPQAITCKISTNDMAVIRTTLALDRTLLAWMRTALTLIGFGFTLAKFVYNLIEKGALPGVHQNYPRELGFTLMGLGIATLLGGIAEHIRMTTRMGLVGSDKWPASLLLAIVLLVVSVLLTWGLLNELSML